MSEHCAERPVSSSAAGTSSVGLSEGEIQSRPSRLNGAFFVGTVLVTQLSWLGALAYGASWLL